MSEAQNQTSPPANTPQQEAAHAAQEAAWAEEQTWPLYQVRLVGDEVEWVPRPNPTYWNEQTDENGVTSWVPKSADELPEHASLHETTGNVVMTAVCVVTVHAKNEDHAKALSMAANPGYHTVDEVQQLDA